MSDDDVAGPGILCRTHKPDKQARKTLEKKMTLTTRKIAQNSAIEVQTSMNDRYSDENKKIMAVEEAEKHTSALRKARNTRNTRKTQSAGVRQERKSRASQADAAEASRKEKMSAEDKAAGKRAERRLTASRTGGISDMLSMDTADSDEAVQRMSMMAKRSPQRNSMAVKLAGIVSPLSPLAKSITMHTAYGFDSPDDITLLAHDDFWGVNDHIRLHAAPKALALPPDAMTGDDGNHQFESIKSHNLDKHKKKESVVEEKGVSLVEGTALPRTTRKTIVNRFQNAIRKSQTGQKIDFDLAGTERVPRMSIALNIGSKAGDASLKSVGMAATGTVRLTGALMRMTVRATRTVAAAAAPHIEAATTRGARMTMKALDYMYDEREKKMTPEEKEQHRAVKKIQKAYRKHYYTPNGPHMNRAARIITKAVIEYKRMIMHEKWMMLIKMELKDKKKRGRMAEQLEYKNATDAMKGRKAGRHAAEAVAKKSGWSGKDPTSKWNKKELAIMAACFLKHGFPVHDNDWSQYYQFFPEKPRRLVRTKLEAMKEDASLGDKATLAGCDVRELEKMGLGLEKKQKAMKVINLADLV